MIDYAVRDRRWMQGNLQHARLIAGPGLHWMSRLHLVMGIMAYLASPLWLARAARAPPSCWSTRSSARSISATGRALSQLAAVPPARFTGCSADALMLFLPKLLAMCSAVLAPRCALFGGRLALIGSVLLETLFSTLLAPVMMLFHTVFVLGILAGRAVGWPPQARGDRGMSWDLALGRHLGQIALGVAAVAVMAYWAPSFLYWLLPVVAGLLLAPLLAVLSSRRSLGVSARRLWHVRDARRTRRGHAGDRTLVPRHGEVEHKLERADWRSHGQCMHCSGFLRHFRHLRPTLLWSAENRPP